MLEPLQLTEFSLHSIEELFVFDSFGCIVGEPKGGIFSNVKVEWPVTIRMPSCTTRPLNDSANYEPSNIQWVAVSGARRQSHGALSVCNGSIASNHNTSSSIANPNTSLLHAVALTLEQQEPITLQHSVKLKSSSSIRRAKVLLRNVYTTVRKAIIVPKQHAIVDSKF